MSQSDLYPYIYKYDLVSGIKSIRTDSTIYWCLLRFIKSSRVIVPKASGILNLWYIPLYYIELCCLFLTYHSKCVITLYPITAEIFTNACKNMMLYINYIFSTIYETELEITIDYAVGSRLHYRSMMQTTILSIIRLYYRLYCKLYYRLDITIGWTIYYTKDYTMSSREHYNIYYIINYAL